MYQNDTVSTDFLNSHAAIFENTIPLHNFLGNVFEFDAIFYPGGHGPMFDLVENKDSIQLIEEFYATEKIVAAVCHGPAVLTNTFLGARPLVENKHVTGFSNNEEGIMNLTQSMPFPLETGLKQRDAIYSTSEEAWAPHVVVDGRLITGQNPNSAREVAEALAQALGI
jgi:putative intracellular protease/amidase